MLLQREQAAIMKIGRTVLDATQRERCNRPLRSGNHAIDPLSVVKSLDFQVVHLVVGVKGR